MIQEGVEFAFLAGCLFWISYLTYFMRWCMLVWGWIRDVDPRQFFTALPITPLIELDVRAIVCMSFPSASLSVSEVVCQFFAKRVAVV